MLQWLVAGALVAAVVALGAVAGRAAVRSREVCPRCRRAGLERINWFRCNPPPNHGFFACGHCGGEFVRIDRCDGIKNPWIARAGSPWETSPGWGHPGRAGASRAVRTDNPPSSTSHFPQSTSDPEENDGR